MARHTDIDIRKTDAQRGIRRSRWAAIGAAIAVTFGGGGLFVASAAPGDGLAYHPLVPVRVIDTRDGTGVTAGALGAGQTMTVSFTSAGVPADAESVTINLTVVGGTQGSFLAVYPAGIDRPGNSSINWVEPNAVANQVRAMLGTGTAVNVYNENGTVHVIIDVLGYSVLENAGTPGATGATGAIGATGVAGVTGDDGATGASGAAGSQGAIGTTGAIGAAGPAGSEGATGAPGRGVNNFRAGNTFFYSVAGTATFGSYDYVSESSNALNTTNGWASYTMTTVGDITTITYTSTRAFYSCFETRIDGSSNTVAGANPNTGIADGRWVQDCVSNSTVQRVVTGASLIEIRMVYGAESTERFNWEANIIG
jgi:hypothetical protein